MNDGDDGDTRPAKLRAADVQLQRLRWALRGSVQSLQTIGAEKTTAEAAIALLRSVLAVAEECKAVEQEISTLLRGFKRDPVDIFSEDWK